MASRFIAQEPRVEVNMKAHPLAERYPLMEGAEYEAFKEDIRVNGVRDAIRTYKGLILDGRNRYRACVELGINATHHMYEFGGDDEAAAAAVDSWNYHRRHLTADFRRKRVADMRAEGLSLRKIAGALRVALKTVQNDLEAGVSKYTPDAGLNDPCAKNPPPPTPKEPDRVQPPAQRPDPAGRPAPPGSAPAAGGGDDDDRPPPRRDPPVAPKITGKDGKLYSPTRPKPKATPPTPVVTVPPPPPPAPPPPVRLPSRKPQGLTRAAEAMNALKMVPPDDPQRAECWKMVRSFLDYNP